MLELKLNRQNDIIKGSFVRWSQAVSFTRCTPLHMDWPRALCPALNGADLLGEGPMTSMPSLCARGKMTDGTTEMASFGKWQIVTALSAVVSHLPTIHMGQDFIHMYNSSLDRSG